MVIGFNCNNCKAQRRGEGLESYQLKRNQIADKAYCEVCKQVMYRVREGRLKDEQN